MKVQLPTFNRDLVGKVALSLWAIGTSVIMTLLMAGHYAFAASPETEATIGFTHRLTGTDEGWQILHVLANGCPCSGDVLKSLLRRKANPGASAEAVVLVGHRPDLRTKLTALGFRYSEVAAESVVDTTGVQSAPTLIVIDPQSRIRYSGGYYVARERTEAKDLEIFASLRAGREVARLPLFGCAFSKELQEAVDPLGLKYSQ